MIRFIAVYYGPSVAEAQLEAISSDPKLVGQVSRLMPDLTNKETEKRQSKGLRLIKAEGNEKPGEA